jgi:hypothetical protein
MNADLESEKKQLPYQLTPRTGREITRIPYNLPTFLLCLPNQREVGFLIDIFLSLYFKDFIFCKTLTY